jgi:hypothetical protein
MSAKLKEAWRFWRMGCIPIDYPAGSVIEDEEVAEIARQCGVVEEEPQDEAKPKRKKKAEE